MNGPVRGVGPGGSVPARVRTADEAARGPLRLRLRLVVPYLPVHDPLKAVRITARPMPRRRGPGTASRAGRAPREQDRSALPDSPLGRCASRRKGGGWNCGAPPDFPT
ncbi:hypothetical protein ACFQ8C_09420 [Streptomyces sp. NPDC056503]|uniref:hypothetical protein n=1 Tax=Streptomyces sp. NPDC056503 TaxID=3345842 RepID=UPI0036943ECD